MRDRHPTKSMAAAKGLSLLLFPGPALIISARCWMKLRNGAMPVPAQNIRIGVRSGVSGRRKFLLAGLTATRMGSPGERERR